MATTSAPSSIIEKDRQCRVCHSKGHGHHFNGRFSCKSCRIFFYRNALNRKFLTCFINGKCKITTTTRSSCNKCRLERCYKIGMIHPIEKKAAQQWTEEVTQPGPTASNLICPSEYQLTSFEATTISRLISSVAFTVINESALPLQTTVQSVLQLSNRTAIYIRLLIRHLKRIPLFRCQPYEMQKQILKAIAERYIALRYCYQYAAHLDGFIVLSDTNANEAVLLKMSLYATLNTESDFKQLKRIVVEFNRELEADMTIRDLLTLITISWQMWHSTGETKMRHYYQIISHLLRRYLESKYNNSEMANKQFAHLLDGLFNRLPQLSAAYSQMAQHFRLHHHDEVYVELLYCSLVLSKN